MTVVDATRSRLRDTGLGRARQAGAAGAAASWLPPSRGSVVGRRGYDLGAPYQTYLADGDGRITIQSEEIDRIEVQLARDSADSAFTGQMRAAGGLGPLPVGSVLNPETGEFTWQPGVAFLGSYDLVFSRWAGNQIVGRQDVRIVLNPKGSNRVGPQATIDTPLRGAGVAQPFVVAGWAADLDAPSGPGVDVVHVWAYRVNEAGTYDDPIWVGAAVLGGARPDVAAVYGDRFGAAGYGLSVQGLAPGTYDLAVFAYSTVRQGFMPAKTVRVVVAGR